MKSEEIKTLFKQFEQASGEIEGIECWSARELQNLLGYSKWENFSKVIDKAKESCLNAGETISDHFPDVRKTIPMPKGAEKEINEILLTRYACYLIAQKGDSRKVEHVDNNLAVRKMLLERGIVPEQLPPAEDIRKVERKLKNEEKSIEKTTRKLPKEKQNKNHSFIIMD